MPLRGRNIKKATTTYQDGLKEGIINDQKGVQYGVEVSKKKFINPADITKKKNEQSNQENKQKHQ